MGNPTPGYATNRMAPAPGRRPTTPSEAPTNTPGPISTLVAPPGRRDRGESPTPWTTQWDPNRGDPTVRKSTNLTVEAPPAPVTPTGPTPAQIAAQQQAAAVAAQQAAFWAQHDAAQRMKAEANTPAPTPPPAPPPTPPPPPNRPRNPHGEDEGD